MAWPGYANSKFTQTPKVEAAPPNPGSPATAARPATRLISDLGPWQSAELEQNLRLRLEPWNRPAASTPDSPPPRLQLRALKNAATRVSASFHAQSEQVYLLEFDIGDTPDRQQRLIVTVLGNWIDGILAGQERPAAREDIARQREKELPLDLPPPPKTETPVVSKVSAKAPEPAAAKYSPGPLPPWTTPTRWSLWLGTGAALDLGRGDFWGFDAASMGATVALSRRWNFESRVRLGTQKNALWRLYRYRLEMGAGMEPHRGAWAFPLSAFLGAEAWSIPDEIPNPVRGEGGWFSVGLGLSGAAEYSFVQGRRYAWRFGFETALRWSAELPGFKYAVVDSPKKFQAMGIAPQLFRIDGLGLEFRLRLRWGRNRRNRNRQ